MSLARLVRAVAATSVLAMAVGLVTTTSAEARPTKPGGLTGLAASVAPHPGDTYDVTATWSPSANATSYRAQVTKGGSVIASATLTKTSWSPTLKTTPGPATVSVKAVVGHRQGKASSVPLTLVDVTDPSGAFSATSDNGTGHATITQDALADDSGAANVTRTVDWGDGSAPQVWTTGTTTITHPYVLTPAQEIRFAATVTLEDAAHNQAVVDVLPAPVFNDTTAPTGHVSVSPGHAWATLTPVTVTQNALADDRTPRRRSPVSSTGWTARRPRPGSPAPRSRTSTPQAASSRPR